MSGDVDSARLLLRREGSGDDLALDLGGGDDDLGGRRSRVRCPRCAWQPRPDDRWGCRCGTVWNTFDTRGVCPGCGHVWDQTQCLRCRTWSRHDDWYASEDGDPRA